MRPLIIFGERPGPNTDPKRPLYPHTTTGAAARLIVLLGWSREQYLEETVRFNVVDNRTTSTAHPECRARVVERMTQCLLVYGPQCRFLFLGKAALNGTPHQYRTLAFNKPRYFGSYGYGMVIPHPSGVNRYYNSEANIRDVTEALKLYARR